MSTYVYGGRSHGSLIEQRLQEQSAQIRALTELVNHLTIRALRLEARCADLTRRIDEIARTPPVQVTAIGHRKGTRSYPADRVRAHIHALRDSGWSQRQIAAATGLSTALISGLTTGKRPYVSPRSEALILTIQPKEKP